MSISRWFRAAARPGGHARRGEGGLQRAGLLQNRPNGTNTEEVFVTAVEWEFETTKPFVGSDNLAWLFSEGVAGEIAGWEPRSALRAPAVIRQTKTSILHFFSLRRSAVTFDEKMNIADQLRITDTFWVFADCYGEYN